MLQGVRFFAPLILRDGLIEKIPGGILFGAQSFPAVCQQMFVRLFLRRLLVTHTSVLSVFLYLWISRAWGGDALGKDDGEPPPPTVHRGGRIREGGEKREGPAEKGKKAPQAEK